MFSWQLIMTVWLPLLAPTFGRRCYNNNSRMLQPAFHNIFLKNSHLSHKSTGHPLVYYQKPTKSSTPLFQSTNAESSSSSSSSQQPLKTLVENTITTEEQIIKKSRFIGIATHCTSWDDAQSHLANVRAEHPKSRHVCFGFVSSSSVETGVGTERCSDDGEPTGTAGAPILGAIKGDGLSDVMCMVVRYSGGIKLGAGGLIRAYGGSARLALRSAPTQTHIPKATVRLSTRTANSGAVYAAAAKFGGVTSGEKYNDRGELELSITCDLENEKRLKEDVVDATRGGVLFLV